MLEETVVTPRKGVNGNTKPPSESGRRAIAVLMAFAEQPTMAPRDVAMAVGIPLPSVYRYLSLLRDFGLLLCDDDTGLHRLSPKVFALAHAAERAETLVDLCRPIMIQLAAACGETVQLMRLAGPSMVCVHQIESGHRLRISSNPGRSLPLGRGASARLLLGSLAPEIRRDYLAEAARHKMRGEALGEKEILEAHQKAWAVSEEEIDEGVWAVAAAIRNGATTVATLTVLAPLVRMPIEKQDELLRQVRNAADKINELLLGPGR